MRTTRTLLAAAVVALLAACGAESTSPLLPGDQPLRDGAGWSGSGNFTDTTTVSTQDGSGFSGSGNVTSTSTDTTTTDRGAGWSGSGN